MQCRRGLNVLAMLGVFLCLLAQPVGADDMVHHPGESDYFLMLPMIQTSGSARWNPQFVKDPPDGGFKITVSKDKQTTLDLSIRVAAEHYDSSEMPDLYINNNTDDDTDFKSLHFNPVQIKHYTLPLNSTIDALDHNLSIKLQDPVGGKDWMGHYQEKSTEYKIRVVQPPEWTEITKAHNLSLATDIPGWDGSNASTTPDHWDGSKKRMKGWEEVETVPAWKPTMPRENQSQFFMRIPMKATQIMLKFDCPVYKGCTKSVNGAPISITEEGTHSKMPEGVEAVPIVDADGAEVVDAETGLKKFLYKIAIGDEVYSQVVTFSCLYKHWAWSPHGIKRQYVLNFQKKVPDEYAKVDMFRMTVTPNYCKREPINSYALKNWKKPPFAKTFTMGDPVYHDGTGLNLVYHNGIFTEDAENGNFTEDGFVCRGKETLSQLLVQLQPGAIGKVVGKTQLLAPNMLSLQNYPMAMKNGTHYYTFRVVVGLLVKDYRFATMTVGKCSDMAPPYGKCYAAKDPNQPEKFLCDREICDEDRDAHCFATAANCTDTRNGIMMMEPGESEDTPTCKSGWEKKPNWEDISCKEAICTWENDADTCCDTITTTTTVLTTTCHHCGTTATTTMPIDHHPVSQHPHSSGRFVKYNIRVDGKEITVNGTELDVSCAWEVNSDVIVVSGSSRKAGSISSCSRYDQAHRKTCDVQFTSGEVMSVGTDRIHMDGIGFRKGADVSLKDKFGRVGSCCSGEALCKVYFDVWDENATYVPMAELRGHKNFIQNEDVLLKDAKFATMSRTCINAQQCEVVQDGKHKTLPVSQIYKVPLQEKGDWAFLRGPGKPEPVQIMKRTPQWSMSTNITYAEGYKEAIVQVVSVMPKKGNLTNRRWKGLQFRTPHSNGSVSGGFHEGTRKRPKLGDRVVFKGRSAIVTLSEEKDGKDRCQLIYQDDASESGWEDVTTDMKAVKFMVGDRVKAYGRDGSIKTKNNALVVAAYEIKFDDTGATSTWIPETVLQALDQRFHADKQQKVGVNGSIGNISKYNQTLDVFYVTYDKDQKGNLKGPLLSFQMQSTDNLRTEAQPFLKGDEVIGLGQEGVIQGGPYNGTNNAQVYEVYFYDDQTTANLSRWVFYRKQNQFKVGQQVVAPHGEGSVISPPKWEDAWQVKCNGKASVEPSAEMTPLNTSVLQVNEKAKIGDMNCTVMYGPTSVAKYLVQYTDHPNEWVRARSLTEIKALFFEKKTQVGQEVTINGRKAIVIYFEQAHQPAKKTDGTYMIRWEDTGRVEGPFPESLWLPPPPPPYHRGQEVLITDPTEDGYMMPHVVVQERLGNTYTIINGKDPKTGKPKFQNVTESGLQAVVLAGMKNLRQVSTDVPRPMLGLLSLAALTVALVAIHGASRRTRGDREIGLLEVNPAE